MMKTRRAKFNAVPTEYKGVRFASKREAAYCAKLDALKSGGVVSYYLTQVPIRLPGGVTYRVDFLVFYSDGRVEYVDVKGMRTPVYKLKKKMVEELYPIKIVEA